ncbi:MAG: ribonuclease P protein component [Candidatus Moraniibacteriota bacterium]
MLPTKHRLTKREDFTLVYKNGYYVALDELSLKFLKVNQSSTRLGFAVGKKYNKRATARNHIRRLMREASRLHLPKLKTGIDLVLMIKPVKKPLQFQTIVITLEKLFKKANLFV